MASRYEWRRISREIPTEELIDELNRRMIGLGSLFAKIGRSSEGGTIMGNDFIELEEYDTTNDAPAPAAERARLYVRDNGAGKEQLVVRFATGAVQVLATEP